MRKLTILLAGLVAIAMLFMPAMAVDQVAIADANGNNIDQTVQNTNYDTHTTSNEVAIGYQTGSNNVQTTTNNNQNINTQGGDIINGATSVSNSQNVAIVFNDAPDHYGLPTGVIDHQITSLYTGEVLVLPNDGGDDTPIIQKHGEKYVYTVRSALPVLIYVINSVDDKMVTTLDGAPVYDTAFKTFDHGSVYVVAGNDRRSTQQQLDFTVEDEGRYSLVVDTRVSQNLNAKLSKVTSGSVDIVYNMEKVSDAVPVNETDIYIGTSEIFRDLNNGGGIDNSEDVILRSFE